MVKKETVGV